MDGQKVDWDQLVDLQVMCSRSASILAPNCLAKGGRIVGSLLIVKTNSWAEHILNTSCSLILGKCIWLWLVHLEV